MRPAAGFAVAIALLTQGAAVAAAQCTIAGAPCDDGLFCTDGDTCDAMLACLGSARGCSDGNDCTDDLCDEASDSCQNPVSAAGTPCSDGVFCTADDTCDGSGGCTSGGLRACDDGHDCTADACNEAAGVCDHDITTGCIVRGDCVADGALDPRDPCRRCDPSQGRYRYSSSPEGAACGAGSCTAGTLTPPPTCDMRGQCIASSSLPTACESGACFDATRCSECTSDGQCAVGQRCDSTTGSCVSLVDAGMSSPSDGGVVGGADGGTSGPRDGAAGIDGPAGTAGLVAHGSGCGACAISSRPEGGGACPLGCAGVLFAATVVLRQRPRTAASTRARSSASTSRSSSRS